MTTPPAMAHYVLAPHNSDSRGSVARGELVVLSGGTPQGFQVGQRYFTRRIRPANTQDPLAASERGSIRTSGWITVVAADERFALARVDHACVAVDAGDYLEPYSEPVLPNAAGGDGAPNFADLGRVLFGMNRTETFGAGDLVSIDRGSAQQVGLGTRVSFYRDRLNGTPLFELGVGTVIEVSAETSKVVVDRAAPWIRIGDYYAIKGTP